MGTLHLGQGTLNVQPQPAVGSQYMNLMTQHPKG